MPEEKLPSNDSNLKKEVRKQSISYILAGFGLVAGLAWNEAIKALITYIFPFGGGSLLALFTYAILVTIVVVLVSRYLSRLAEK